MITKNIGMLLLAIYLILVGLMGSYRDEPSAPPAYFCPSWRSSPAS